LLHEKEIGQVMKDLPGTRWNGHRTEQNRTGFSFAYVHVHQEWWRWWRWQKCTAVRKKRTQWLFRVLLLLLAVSDGDDYILYRYFFFCKTWFIFI